MRQASLIVNFKEHWVAWDWQGAVAAIPPSMLAERFAEGSPGSFVCEHMIEIGN